MNYAATLAAVESHDWARDPHLVEDLLRRGVLAHVESRACNCHYCRLTRAYVYFKRRGDLERALQYRNLMEATRRHISIAVPFTYSMGDLIAYIDKEDEQ